MREYITHLKNILQNKWIILFGVAGVFGGTYQYFQNIPQSSKEVNEAIAIGSAVYLVGVRISLYRDSRRSKRSLNLISEFNRLETDNSEGLTGGFDNAENVMTL
jgi:hypothetical protein